MTIQWRYDSGFTLIELLLVLVIIGVLAGAVVTSLSGRSDEARVARARADISGSLSLALDLFEQDVGRYPTAAEGLQALIQDPGAESWKGPYLKGGKIATDPWNRPYVYSVVSADAGRYTLLSVGPDAQQGTEDDVTE